MSVTQTAPALQTLTLQRPGREPAFKTLGLVKGFHPTSLERSIILLIGPTGSGKSTVIASMGPRTCILDFDHAYGNIPCSHATRMTPGRIIDTETGSEKICDPWEHWLAMMEWLKTEGRKFYDTVVFDTVDQWVRLMEAGMAQAVNRRYAKITTGTPKEPIQSIVDLGKGGYKKLVDQLVLDWNSLRNSGYGLVFTGHLERRRIVFSETKVEMDIPCLGLYPSLDKALRRCADFVIKCIRGRESCVIHRDRIVKGKKIGSVPETVTSKVVKLIFDEEVVNAETSTLDTVKNRVEMPNTIILPAAQRHEAWALVREAHNQACSEQAKKHATFLGATS